MSAPPLCLYSRHVAPSSVLELLSQKGELSLQGTPEDWSSATVKWKRGLFSKSKVTVNHNREHYAGPGWETQVRGMHNTFAELGARPEVLRLIRSFRFVVALPGQKLQHGSIDPTQELLKSIARRLDGVFFLPGFLLDPEGFVLTAPGGEFDPSATLPNTPQSAVSELPDDEGEPSADETADADVERTPPDAQRVYRRALVLAALSLRAITERDPEAPEIAVFRERLWNWVCQCGLESELEDHERELLSSRVELEPQASINAVWCVEALSVLSWALGKTEVPSYDTLVTPLALWRAFEVFQDAEAVAHSIETASLRSPEELEAMQKHQLAFHWRMVDLRAKRAPVDFEAFSKKCWFGSFPLDDFNLIDDDLALKGKPVSQASADARSVAESTARERHHAITWLLGDSSVYSETESST